MDSFQKQIDDLKTEVEKIKARNKKVEADKSWETSRTRTIFVAISTYVLILILFILIKNEKPFTNALIPSVAYIISTETYGILKKWWLKNKNQ